MWHHLISVWQRLVALVRRRRIADEIDDEIAFHIAMRRDEGVVIIRRPLGPEKGFRTAWHPYAVRTTQNDYIVTDVFETAQ